MAHGIGGEQGKKTCPVCGCDMKDRDPVGHSQVHFPTDPIPARPETLSARRQQAELLGKKPPEE